MVKKGQTQKEAVTSEVVDPADKYMVPNTNSVPAPKPVESLSEADKHVLEVASLNMKLARSNAEKAIAENNSADVSYRYVVLQLYMKYGLTSTDALDEKGVIHRGVNVAGGQV